jgi:hypothetical protein
MRYFRPGGAETPAKGYGILKIGKELGIGTSAVQRVIAAGCWRACLAGG